METLTVIQLIKNLEGVVKDGNGHLPVFVSSDPEGNSFGTISNEYSVAYNSSTPTTVVIYPFEQTDDPDKLTS